MGTAAFGGGGATPFVLPEGFTSMPKELQTTGTSGQTTDTSRTGRSSTSAVTDDSRRTQQSNRQQNISDEALAAINAIISGQTIDPLVSAKDEAAGSNITQLQRTLGFADPVQAETRASGRVAELSRNLREGALPEIFGGAEASGTGGNALAQLLGQDAAIRTGEAQNRAIEEAINTAISQRTQGAQTMGALTSGTSAANERLMEALGLAKGAVVTGESDTTETGRSTTASTTDTTDTTKSEATGETSAADPLAWLRMLQQGQQIPGVSQGGSDPARTLAAFTAAGGNLGGFGSDERQGRLYQTIQGLIG